MVDWFSFLPPFFGVLAAFGLDRLVDAVRKFLSRRNLLRDLHEELKDIETRLNKQVSPLYSDIWESAISSGQIRLLKSEQIRKLKKVYDHVESVKANATRVKDIEQDFRKAPSGIMMVNGGRTRIEDEKQKWHKEFLHKLWSDYVNVHNSQENELRGKIDEILKEKWLDCPKKKEG